ncbi:MAG: hypothetical protein JZD41_04725 [Thermoproteus sp.]|nr:hypothetical protein [Thermoproteus sp.]
MTPVGELVRYVVLARLARGPTPVEEIEALVRAAVERTGRKFDWRIWPQLLAREIAIENDVARLTERDRFLAAIGLKAMGSYIEKLGIDPDMMKMRVGMKSNMWREPATR